MCFITEESEDDRDDSEEEVATGEAELADEDGETDLRKVEEKEKADEEFVDKEYESQFCLEANFVDGENEDEGNMAEEDMSTGEKS